MISFFGIFAAGVLTFLSPCILPLAPILVASLLTTNAASRWGRFRATLWFAIGFSVVFVLLGLAVPAITNVLGPLKPLLSGLAAAIFILFGLKMLHVIDTTRHFAWMERSLRLPVSGRLPQGPQALLFGAVFGLGWTPCVGPILAGVLAYVATHQHSLAQNSAMLLVFAAGIALPLLAIAVAAEYTVPVLRRLRAYVPMIEYAAGVGLVVFGAVLLNQSRLQLHAPERRTVQAVDDNAQVVALGAATAQAPRLVFFHAKNCPLCKAMEPLLPALERDCSAAHLEIVRVDVDRAENAAAVARFQIRAVPTISILNPQGHEVRHLVGYQSEAHLRQAAEDAAPIACARRDPGPAPLEPEQDSTCALHKVC